MTIIEIARGELGYLEKATNARLEDKTANVGSSNYTKYGAWYGLNGQPWCDMFVSWCAHRAGVSEAVGRFAYVPAHVDFFRRRGAYFPRGSAAPRAGDVIFFRNESHVGLVEAVTASAVTTIEGNTSSGSALVTNGGGVFRKTYPLTSAYIMGYGRPAYPPASVAPTEKEEFPMPKTYRNGSTPEPVYADTGLTIPIGSLNPWETCQCLAVVDGRYLVSYQVDGTGLHKAGFARYSGGVKGES